MRRVQVGVAILIAIVVVALIALVLVDTKATERRLEMLPLPTATPSPAPTPSPTPTPAPSLRVIYAIPADGGYDVRYETAIRDAVLGVQRWLGEQLSGVTFALSGSLPQVCLIDKPASHFHGTDGWHKVADAVQHCDPVEYRSKWHTWLIYIDVAVPCGDEDTFVLGRGGGGVAVLHGGDIQGLIEEDGYKPCDNGRWGSWPRGRWEGGMAHELTHAFGIGHPEECNADPECGDRSLMWQGFVDYPDTFLHDKDIADLSELLRSHTDSE